MERNNEFIHLAKYSRVPGLDYYDESKALNELIYWIENPNDKVIHTIDFEKLIYIELTYPNNLEIQEKIFELKKIINNNYVLRKRLIARLYFAEDVSEMFI